MIARSLYLMLRPPFLLTLQRVDMKPDESKARFVQSVSNSSVRFYYYLLNCFAAIKQSFSVVSSIAKTLDIRLNLVGLYKKPFA
jgi:hypothetical protein